uniref:Calmin n=1 Tax=Zeugodacus cucurbitae TaxID=28588 RepID=A0A0A1XHE0_ZEUCU
MFRQQNYFAKLAIFAVITVQLLVLMQAREISQCGSKAEEFIENNDPICNTIYTQVYCNGAGSAYCTNDGCEEEFECTAPTTTVSTTTYRRKCESGMEFVEPYPDSSRYYYYCAKGYFGIRDCGLFMLFDGINKKCKIKK